MAEFFCASSEGAKCNATEASASRHASARNAAYTILRLANRPPLSHNPYHGKTHNEPDEHSARRRQYDRHNEQRQHDNPGALRSEVSSSRTSSTHRQQGCIFRTRYRESKRSHRATHMKNHIGLARHVNPCLFEGKKADEALAQTKNSSRHGQGEEDVVDETLHDCGRSQFPAHPKPEDWRDVEERARIARQRPRLVED